MEQELIHLLMWAGIVFVLGVAVGQVRKDDKNITR